MEKKYRHFTLRQGNLLDHEGGAIVLPGFPDPVAVVGSLAKPFYEKLQAAGVSYARFRDLIWKGMSSQTIDDLAALYIEKPSPDLPYDLILSACIQCAYDLQLYHKAAQATENVISTALENGVSEVAFPILLTGGEGGIIEQNAPAMAAQFNRRGKNEKSIDFFLYAYGKDAYEQANKALKSF